MKRHLLVFDANFNVDLRAFVDSLDQHAKMYALGGASGVIESDLPVEQIADRFLHFASSSLFFIADITDSPYSGRMPGVFWDDFKRPELANAAE